MGVRKAKPALLFSILLASLLLSVCGTFFSFHNLVVTTPNPIHMWPILFTIATLIIGLAMYLSVIRTNSLNQKITEQFESLKKTIEQSKNGKNGKTEAEDKGQQHFNSEAEAAKLLPIADLENLEIFAEQLLKNIAKAHNIVQGIYFAKNDKDNEFNFIAGYAFYSEIKPQSFVEGETLPGQVAKTCEALLLDQVPDGYITILSGLGKGTPHFLLLVPILSEEGKCVGVFEVASFKPISSNNVQMFSTLGKLIDPLLKKTANSSQE